MLPAGLKEDVGELVRRFEAEAYDGGEEEEVEGWKKALVVTGAGWPRIAGLGGTGGGSGERFDSASAKNGRGGT